MLIDKRVGLCSVFEPDSSEGLTSPVHPVKIIANIKTQEIINRISFFIMTPNFLIITH